MAGLSTVALVTAGWATVAASAAWPLRTTDQVTASLQLTPAWLLPIVGLLLYRWRPTSRSGLLTIALGLAWSVWVALSWSVGSHEVWGLAALVMVRPIAFLLLLSWPTGRIRSAPRWLWVYVAVSITMWGAVRYLFSEQFDHLGVDNPLAVASAPRMVAVADALTVQLIVPVGAVALAISLSRRYRLLPPTAAYLAAPVLVAGLLLAIWDVILPITSHVGSVLRDDQGEWTLIGTVYVATDMLRFALLPLLLGVGAVRIQQLAVTTDPARRVELDGQGSTSDLAGSLSRALGGTPAVVGFRGSDDGWLDDEGVPIEMGGPGRFVTVIERDHVPVAAVAVPTESLRRPGLVEAAVSAVGASVELQRLEAMANARRRRADRARRAIIDVGDTTRLDIQRDLHDGAQQRLVGLLLQTQLALSAGTVDDPAVRGEVLAGIAAARAELACLVDGDTVVRDRTLTEAIAELASTVPIPVVLDLDLPDDLPTAVRSTAWFVAAEATANAVKHADASCLHVSGDRRDGRVLISVADDGTGAVDDDGNGLVGLRRRVERVGGCLRVDGVVGAGTRIVAELPVGVVA